MVLLSTVDSVFNRRIYSIADLGFTLHVLNIDHRCLTPLQWSYDKNFSFYLKSFSASELKAHLHTCGVSNRFSLETKGTTSLLRSFQ
jgi:hypothetical protein